jgi:hypothetical protein
LHHSPNNMVLLVHWNSRVMRVLIPCLDRNQRKKLKQGSKEFYLQRSK